MTQKTLVRIQLYTPNMIMNAFEYLKYLKEEGFIPDSKEGKKLGRPSNSELKRWLEKGSVNINNKHPKPDDEIEFPIKKLVYFDKSERPITVIYDDFVWLQDYADKLVKNFHKDWRIVYQDE